MILRECDDPPIFNDSRKSPVQSHVAELVVATTEPGSLRERFGTSLESGWKNLRRGCNSWKRKWVDADRAARTPVTPIAQDARGNLVDLGVGNKLETFAGETHEWKGWSFKMRQYIAAVDEELYLELVNVEANPLREVPLVGMNEPQKRRARQLAFMLNDAHERSCTPDDHETERSSEWIRNLETFSGRVGADTQRTVPSDADAVAAVSVYGRQRSGLGGVGTTCATI